MQSQSMDANIAGQSMTADRMKEVDMAGPYYYATIVCVTTKDSPYASAKSIQDLAGGKCTAQSGTIWYDSCLPQIPNAQKLAPAETAPAMIMQLQTGSVDFICTDMPTAMGAVAKDDNLVILNFSGTEGDFQFATEAERAENTGSVDFICTDMPTAMGAVAKDDNLVILNFSGTEGDFQFATEAERAENVNIGISVRKDNTALKQAIESVLSQMTQDDFNALMDQAISVQPEV